eukprot:GEMP01022693.1.p1 GENE.GEMP01022693.1~~GEMP01022693.1.p1  ORF type:complete len:436 (+),score=67.49 GEMP01022693.1:323-1630(+)
MLRLPYLYLLLLGTVQGQATGSGLDCKGFGPLKVVFVIDGSGSLKGNFPHEWETAKKLFQGLIDAYGPKYAAENIHAGIIQFSTKAFVERPIGLGTNAFDNRPRWRQGGTNFKPAIDKAASMINRYNAPQAANARKLIIMVADGAPNVDCGGAKTGGFFGIGGTLTETETCVPNGIPIMSVYIPTPIPARPGDDPESTRPMHIMRKLTPCASLVEGTGKYKAEGAYGLDASGQRCPYLIISAGPHRYAEVQKSAKAFAQAVMDKIEKPFFCKANEHVLGHKCAPCPGRPVGDNACAGDTPCASREKPDGGSGGGKKPDDGSGEGANSLKDASNQEDASLGIAELLAIGLPIIAVMCIASCFAMHKRNKKKKQNEPSDEGFMAVKSFASSPHRSTRSTRVSSRVRIKSSSRHGKTTGRKKHHDSQHSAMTKSTRRN